MNKVYTSGGNVVQVGRELGKGGEGSVFEIAALPDQVAKLYHRAVDAKKQAKLRFMASASDAELLRYVAWPLDTLHSIQGGPVVGFLMPKAANKEPVHNIYSPAHRKQEKPKAAWDYLLYVARNTAAAFDMLHSRGHVLGDVNQGNVYVGSDSKVVLIDSDSFQVSAADTLHLCEVGVAHFTPPELQGLSSFDKQARTPNHDNFGLALIIFHLLLGGRHPFAGVPLKPGAGDALESDIKDLRYAYGRDSRARGSEPPPKSIPVGSVPSNMESMFFYAFTEQGAKGARPTAKQWVAALDAIRTGLKKCSVSPVHIYAGHLSDCPWCTLERQGVQYFVDNTVAPQLRTHTGFVLARAWTLIEAISAPQTPPVPMPMTAGLQAKALPAGVPSSTNIGVYRALAVLFALGFCMALPGAWFIGAALGVTAWVVTGNIGSNERAAEKRTRQASLDWAQGEYTNLVKQYNDRGRDGFSKLRQELAACKTEYQGLAEAEKAEMEKLKSTAQARQLQKHMDSFFIDSASISGLGPARKSALRSFGIETAADCEKNKIRSIRGFGDSLTRAVMDWKASCERKFVFNPGNAITAADRAKVRNSFANRQASLETRISAGAVELTRFRDGASAATQALMPQVEWAAKKLGQAKLDYEAL